MAQKILTSFSNGVETITLNDPPTLNAFDLTMATELEEELHRAEADPEVKVLILAGKGRAFSAGGDIRYMKAHCDEPDFVSRSMGPLAQKLSEVVLCMKQMSKIIIASVQGAAAGGGANVAFACDFIVAAENAKFVEAFQGIGLCPDTGGTYILPRLIGAQRAFDLFATGRVLTADEAKDIGLVKEITKKEDLAAASRAFAEKLAAGPLLAYANMKHLLYESMFKGFKDFMKTESRYVGQCSSSADFREGITAFLEKRKPRFQGK